MQWLLDRFPDRLLRSEMDDSVDGVLYQSGADGGTIENTRPNKGHIVGDTMGVARGEVVEHDHGTTRGTQGPQHVGPDVSGTSGEQPGGHAKRSPVRRS